ncbi:MAG TPA: hypothetical protein VE825_04465 [Terriglobales bacterium]|nr:hypothetical protein [Terriglobales bacterium]
MFFSEYLYRRGLALLAACVFSAAGAAPAPVPVRHEEGLLHGFLVLRTLQGETLAHGDLLQNVHGDRVTSRLTLHFKDGSIHDETAVFSQRGSFRLLSDHLVQRGPAFERAVEMTVDGEAGQVTVRYSDDGKDKTTKERLALPPDLCNGMIFTLLKNIRPGAPETKVSFLAPTPQPRMVRLSIRPQGEEPFDIAGVPSKAMRYDVKVELGGLSGALASLLGKEPPDTQVWILEGEAPVFVKSEGALAPGGPVWRIEAVSPSWPRAAGPQEKK